MYSRLVLNFYHSWRWLWTDLPALPLPPLLWDKRDVPPHQVNAVLGMEPRDSHLLGKPSAHSYALMANVSVIRICVSGLRCALRWDSEDHNEARWMLWTSVQQDQGLHSQQVVAESMRSDTFTITSPTILRRKSQVTKTLVFLNNTVYCHILVPYWYPLPVNGFLWLIVY